MWGYFLRECAYRRDLCTFLLTILPDKGIFPLAPSLTQASVLTLIQVIMEGASMAGTGGRDLRARHVTVGREGDVAVPACLQAHLFCKHL